MHAANSRRSISMERNAHIATVAPAVIAAAAFLFGVCQFTQTQKLARKNLELQAETLQQERESKAVDLFLKFNEKQQELAAKPPPRKGEAAFWRYNAMLSTTEAVYILTRGDVGWEETVSWMLEVQQPYLKQTQFPCKTFSQDFLVEMRKAVPGLKCI
jgi:hypothetical protein